MAHPEPRDWAFLGSLVLMWGTAFLAIRITVASVPPTTLAFGRIAIAAAVLAAGLRVTGLRLPAPGRIWLYLAIMATVGNALPFTAIAWGQQRVPSSLAGILMAVMPLATLCLAHFLVPGERITSRRGLGFGLGFAGIVVLMGPSALLELGGASSDLVYQGAVLVGALCYATNTIVTRRAPAIDARVASAGVMLCGAVLLLPLALWLDRPWELEASPASLGALLWLGIVPTGLATVVYFRVIGSAGPTFLSSSNYLIPLVALGVGAAAGERVGLETLLALTLILAGLYLGQRRRAPNPEGPAAD